MRARFTVLSETPIAPAIAGCVIPLSRSNTIEMRWRCTAGIFQRSAVFSSRTWRLEHLPIWPPESRQQQKSTLPPSRFGTKLPKTPRFNQLRKRYYKSAFVLLHKLREAMAEEMKGRVVGGEGKTAEVDGGYFGGYVKPANLKEYRRDRRFAENQSGKRKVVVVARQRGGRSLPAVFK